MARLNANVPNAPPPPPPVASGFTTQQAAAPGENGGRFTTEEKGKGKLVGREGAASKGLPVKRQIPRLNAGPKSAPKRAPAPALDLTNSSDDEPAATKNLGADGSVGRIVDAFQSSVRGLTAAQLHSMGPIKRRKTEWTSGGPLVGTGMELDEVSTKSAPTLRIVPKLNVSRYVIPSERPSTNTPARKPLPPLTTKEIVPDHRQPTPLQRVTPVPSRSAPTKSQYRPPVRNVLPPSTSKESLNDLPQRPTPQRSISMSTGARLSFKARPIHQYVPRVIAPRFADNPQQEVEVDRIAPKPGSLPSIKGKERRPVDPPLPKPTPLGIRGIVGTKKSGLADPAPTPAPPSPSSSASATRPMVYRPMNGPTQRAIPSTIKKAVEKSTEPILDRIAPVAAPTTTLAPAPASTLLPERQSTPVPVFAPPSRYEIGVLQAIPAFDSKRARAASQSSPNHPAKIPKLVGEAPDPSAWLSGNAGIADHPPKTTLSGMVDLTLDDSDDESPGLAGIQSGSMVAPISPTIVKTENLQQHIPLLPPPPRRAPSGSSSTLHSPRLLPELESVAAAANSSSMEEHPIGSNSMVPPPTQRTVSASSSTLQSLQKSLSQLEMSPPVEDEVERIEESRLDKRKGRAIDQDEPTVANTRSVIRPSPTPTIASPSTPTCSPDTPPHTHVPIPILSASKGKSVRKIDWPAGIKMVPMPPALAWPFGVDSGVVKNPLYGVWRGNTPLIRPASSSEVEKRKDKGKGKEREMVVTGVDHAPARRVTRGQLSEVVAQIDAMHDQPETIRPLSAVPSRLQSFVPRHHPSLPSPNTTDEDHRYDFLIPQVGPHTQASETIHHPDGTETLRPALPFYSYPKNHRRSETRMQTKPFLLPFTYTQQALMDPYEANISEEDRREELLPEVGYEARRREVFPERY